jgi:cytochrome c biogenesis protein ResB
VVGILPEKRTRAQQASSTHWCEVYKKSEYVHMYSCCAVFCVILTAFVVSTMMCIYVIYKYSKSETLFRRKNLGKPS